MVDFLFKKYNKQRNPSGLQGKVSPIALAGRIFVAAPQILGPIAGRVPDVALVARRGGRLDGDTTAPDADGRWFSDGVLIGRVRPR